MADAAAHTIVPLEIRPSLRLGLSPWAWGLLVAGTLMAGALVFRAMAEPLGIQEGTAPADIDFATRVALVASASIGYSLAVWRWVSAAISRDFDALGLIDHDGTDDPMLAVPPEILRTSRLAGLAGIAFFVSTIEVPTWLTGGPPASAWTSLHPLTYMLFLGVVFFWVTGRAA